jgi:hypothetical protein
MRYLAITLGTLLLASAAQAQLRGSCGATPVLSTEDNGKRIELILNGDQVAKTAKWDPTKGEPPLSVSKAAAAALAWAKVKYKRYDSVQITEISLHQYSCSELDEHWYYRIEFAPMMDGNKLFGSGNWAAVLMDGTVVGPVEKSAPTP